MATVKPSGSVYRDRKPVVSVRLGEDYIQNARGNPYCITPVLSSDPNLVAAVKDAVGSDKVRIKDRYSGLPLMPWNSNPSGREMNVDELLGIMHEEGWPGYDAFLEGVQVFRGTGRFGREVFAVCPITTGFELGGVEVYPVKQT